jgi:hypothetical protein
MSESIALSLPPAALVPLIRQVVEETVARLESIRATIPANRLAFSEAEAAALLGLRAHQLRDERIRGKIVAARIVGRRLRYTVDDLLGYLATGKTVH